MITVVYVAAPYRGASQLEELHNVRRACLIGRLATLEGRAPIVVHPALISGVYGHDRDPGARAFGLECAAAIVQCTAHRVHAELWALLNDDSSPSEGVQLEIETWARSRHTKSGIRSATWQGWRALAARHRLEPIWDALAGRIPTLDPLAAAALEDLLGAPLGRSR